MAEPAAQSYIKLQGEEPLAGAKLQARVSFQEGGYRPLTGCKLCFWAQQKACGWCLCRSWQSASFDVSIGGAKQLQCL